MIREVVAGSDQRVGVIDYHAWLTATGRHADVTWRPDGVHLSDPAAKTLAEEWLAPLLVTVALGG